MEAGFDAYVGKPINLKEFLEAPRAPRARGEAGVTTAQAKVMVVDDTPHNVKLLADLLGVKGYAVCTAATGEEALAKLPAEKPDLVLLDIMMPGLSGYEVCARIRADAATALLPVVLVTRSTRSRSGQGHRGGRRRLPVQADQSARALRAGSLAAARQGAAGRSEASGRRAEGLERQARAARRRAGQADRPAGAIEAFFLAAIADAIVSCRRAVDPGAASAGNHLRLHRPSRIHGLYRSRRARGGAGGAARVPGVDGRRRRRLRGHARSLRRRRYPDFLQRSAADSRSRQARGEHGANDAGGLCATPRAHG